jgi:large subunit ribosomal protein L25
MASTEIVLTAEKRTETGKGPARRLRAAGKVPAVIYGHGKSATGLTIDAHEFLPLMHHSGLLKIKVEGRKRDLTALVKDIQYDIIRGHVKHVDFQEVRADEMVTASISIEAHGTPAGEQHGGVLEQVIHEVEIRCPANQLPEVITVEVGELELHQALTAGELPIPADATLEIDPEQIIMHVVEPRMKIEEAEEAVEGEEAAEAEAGEEPELIAKGKGEGAEEEAEKTEA